METYLVQSEEKRIDFDLLHALAAVLSEELGIPRVDALAAIRRSQGILPVPRERAACIAERFRGAGLATVIQDRLLPLPPLSPLDWPAIESSIELAVGGLVETVRTKTIGSYPVVKGESQEWWPLTVDKLHSTYHLDLFTREKHWQIVSEDTPQDAVRRLTSLRRPGFDCHLVPWKRFSDEIDYSRYVDWRFQLRYAVRRQ